MLKVTYKSYGAGQALIFLIAVIVNLYFHVTIINKIYIKYIYIYGRVSVGLDLLCKAEGCTIVHTFSH